MIYCMEPSDKLISFSPCLEYFVLFWSGHNNVTLSHNYDSPPSPDLNYFKKKQYHNKCNNIIAYVCKVCNLIFANTVIVDTVVFWLLELIRNSVDVGGGHVN